jgi:hypothetical protein
LLQEAAAGHLNAAMTPQSSGLTFSGKQRFDNYFHNFETWERATLRLLWEHGTVAS